MWNWLKGKKTHISIIGAVLSGLAALVAGDITPLEFGLIVFGGGSVSSLRAAVATK
jgi:hypothetical protein